MQRPPWPFPNFSRNAKPPAQRANGLRATLRMPGEGSKNEVRELQALASLLDKRMERPHGRANLHTARERIRQRLAQLGQP